MHYEKKKKTSMQIQRWKAVLFIFSLVGLPLFSLSHNLSLGHQCKILFLTVDANELALSEAF